MPVTKEQFDAVFKIARANPGVVIDKQRSNKYQIFVVHGKKQRRWKIDGRGRISRVET